MTKKIPPREPIERLFAQTLFDVMQGMIKADSVDPRFKKIKETAKGLTKTKMRRIANLAGKYCAEHFNPSPRRLSKEQVEKLKREALEFALTADRK